MRKLKVIDFIKQTPDWHDILSALPYNRIVVPHEDIKIYHIGTKDNTTLQELDIDIGITKRRTYQFNDLNEVIEMAKTLKYCEEGYVVRDANYHRVKIKSPAYVAIHHLVSDMSDKKDYAEEVLKTKISAFFFQYFDKRVASPAQWLWEQSNNKILENLNKLMT